MVVYFPGGAKEIIDDLTKVLLRSHCYVPRANDRIDVNEKDEL